MALFVFLEGDDDHRFLQTIIVPRLQDRFDAVNLWRYAEQKKAVVDALVKGVEAGGDQYLFLADLDAAESVEERKKALCNEIPTLRLDRIIIVVSEIEGWYLAGLDAQSQRAMRIDAGRIPHRTDEVVKEDLAGIIPPNRYRSTVDFFREVLNRFAIPEARRRNDSFDYFCARCGL
ncbi:MAG TPA: hypothetical protein VF529_19625 [Solirubrobacteraceae bacterium]|jgi:hypothetical protein